jgi:hypothetical protein
MPHPYIPAEERLEASITFTVRQGDKEGLDALAKSLNMSRGKLLRLDLRQVLATQARGITLNKIQP